MDLKPWNPWQELERVQVQVDMLFASVLRKLASTASGKSITFVPATDIIEVEEEYRLYLSLPGLVEEDIDLSLEGNILIVRGEREPPFDPERVVAHQRQWKYGYFERRVQLPAAVGEESIQATYEAGVLTIRIPRGPSEREAREKNEKEPDTKEPDTKDDEREGTTDDKTGGTSDDKTESKEGTS